jgi:hypothetical protein
MNKTGKSKELEALRAENERLMQWVNDLQSGMYVNCVYCGHRYGPADKVPASMADVLKEHIAHCPEHPMSKLREEMERVKEERDDYQKAFALACRILDDSAGQCPAVIYHTGWDECNGETEACGDGPMWGCWQRYIRERVANEGVCRVCGCTEDNACQPDGSYWVEEDLCSACVRDLEEEGL